MPDLSWLYDLVGRAVPLECMQQRFMQQAFVALVLLAPMAAALGVQVINFRMAFFSDAISHSAFAGVALGLIFSVDVRLSMVLLALVIGLGIVALGRRTSLSADTVTCNQAGGKCSPSKRANSAASETSWPRKNHLPPARTKSLHEAGRSFVLMKMGK